MTNRSRRELLCATGALALAAGCIADDFGGSSESDEGPEEDGDSEEDDEPGSNESTDNGSTDNGSTDNGSTDNGSTDNGSTDNGSTDDEAEDSVETRSFRHTGPTPEPTGVLFPDAERAAEWLEERRIDSEGEGESVVEFVDETVFERAALVALEASAPNLCYELDLESATVEDGRLELEAVVTDESDDEMGCAQQETTVGYLIRASAGGEPIREASATVVDRDGAAHDLEIDAENERDGDGAGDDGAEGDGAEDDEDA
jgi:hypothetical protein